MFKLDFFIQFLNSNNTVIVFFTSNEIHNLLCIFYSEISIGLGIVTAL